MDEKQKVDGFRSAKEVLREYLDELLSKTEDPTNRNFLHEQIDNLDNQEDRSNSNLLFAVLRQKEDGEFSPFYLDGLCKPWNRYKDDPIKFFLIAYLSGKRLHHAYVAERGKDGFPIAWYLYFE